MSEPMVINAEIDLRLHNLFIHEQCDNNFALALFTGTEITF